MIVAATLDMLFPFRTHLLQQRCSEPVPVCYIVGPNPERKNEGDNEAAVEDAG